MVSTNDQYACLLNEQVSMPCGMFSCRIYQGSFNEGKIKSRLQEKSNSNNTVNIDKHIYMKESLIN